MIHQLSCRAPDSLSLNQGVLVSSPGADNYFWYLKASCRNWQTRRHSRGSVLPTCASQVLSAAIQFQEFKEEAAQAILAAAPLFFHSTSQTWANRPALSEFGCSFGDGHNLGQILAFPATAGFCSRAKPGGSGHQGDGGWSLKARPIACRRYRGEGTEIGKTPFQLTCWGSSLSSGTPYLVFSAKS